MSVLPKIQNAVQVGRVIDSWRQTLTQAIRPTAQPLLVPRNTRCRALAGQKMVRFEWDPGSRSLDGFDVSWSARPNFEFSQSRRLTDPKALLLEVPVDTSKKWAYFRVRAFIGSRVSRWSPTHKCPTAATLEPAEPVPDGLDFSVRLEDYGIVGLKDITVAENPEHVEELHFNAVSIDETDQGFYATGFPAASTADPLTFLPTLTGTSRRGEVFAKGRFVLLADFAVSAGKYKHEMFQISDIVGGNWTIRRHGRTDPAGQARFGTLVQTHVANLRMYPLELRRFEFQVGPNAIEETPPATPSGVPDRLLPLLPSHCVIAVKGAGKNKTTYGNWRTVSLIPSPATLRQNPPAPGLRTENGGQYTLEADGDMVVKKSMAQWIRVSQWATLRSVFAHMKAAPTGADLKIAVLYVEPPGAGAETTRKVALLDTVTVLAGKFHSYDPADSAGAPDGRNTPYRETWPFSVLPTVGTLGTLFDGASEFTGALPLVLDGGSILFAPDGHLLWVCTQIGSGAAGSNGEVEVQT